MLRNGEQILHNSVTFVTSNLKLETMKTVSKHFLPELFNNSINRNLTLIFLFGLLVAVSLVTAGIILVNQL